MRSAPTRRWLLFALLVPAAGLCSCGSEDDPRANTEDATELAYQVYGAGRDQFLRVAVDTDANTTIAQVITVSDAGPRIDSTVTISPSPLSTLSVEAVGEHWLVMGVECDNYDRADGAERCDPGTAHATVLNADGTTHLVDLPAEFDGNDVELIGVDGDTAGFSAVDADGSVRFGAIDIVQREARMVAVAPPAPTTTTLPQDVPVTNTAATPSQPDRAGFDRTACVSHGNLIVVDQIPLDDRGVESRIYLAPLNSAGAMRLAGKQSLGTDVAQHALFCPDGSDPSLVGFKGAELVPLLFPLDPATGVLGEATESDALQGAQLGRTHRVGRYLILELITALADENDESPATEYMALSAQGFERLDVSATNSDRVLIDDRHRTVLIASDDGSLRGKVIA